MEKMMYIWKTLLKLFPKRVVKIMIYHKSSKIRIIRYINGKLKCISYGYLQCCSNFENINI